MSTTVVYYSYIIFELLVFDIYYETDIVILITLLFSVFLFFYQESSGVKILFKFG